MHLSLTSKLFGRRMTTAMSADSWLRRTRLDFAREISRASSVCACRAPRSAGSRIAGSLRRTACRTHPGFARRCRAYPMRVSELRGASLARRSIATKQRWLTPKRGNNSAAQLAASNSCNKNLSGWRRKSPRRSYWRFVLRASWKRAHRVLRKFLWRNATMSGWHCNVRARRGTFSAQQASRTSIP